jgi:hypothetical protein
MIMRYLAVFVFLAGCGDYSSSSFEEMPVCFEDGTWSKPSEKVVAGQDLSKDGRLVTDPEPSGEDGISGSVSGANPSHDFRLPCAKTEVPDGVECCFVVVCEGSCTPMQRAGWPPCGARYCLPRDDGWADPGYPEPLLPGDVDNVH